MACSHVTVSIRHLQIELNISHWLRLMTVEHGESTEESLTSHRHRLIDLKLNGSAHTRLACVTFLLARLVFLHSILKILESSLKPTLLSHALSPVDDIIIIVQKPLFSDFTVVRLREIKILYIRITQLIANVAWLSIHKVRDRSLAFQIQIRHVKEVIHFIRWRECPFPILEVEQENRVATQVIVPLKLSGISKVLHI